MGAISCAVYPGKEEYGIEAFALFYVIHRFSKTVIELFCRPFHNLVVLVFCCSLQAVEVLL